ncbi:hypothetical protein BpHYR1_038706 [Brachionus plicatilis]|uniref:Uncharacterized protein n=1 Tax=Brachionus plicatilis TaxID=10195 RepID=A0A3M7SAI9_BRAPC|nr:hypothetical protein BpHYR1_038706 [Brachionus plicatilis]
MSILHLLAESEFWTQPHHALTIGHRKTTDNIFNIKQNFIELGSTLLILTGESPLTLSKTGSIGWRTTSSSRIAQMLQLIGRRSTSSSSNSSKSKYFYICEQKQVVDLFIKNEKVEKTPLIKNQTKL